MHKRRLVVALFILMFGVFALLNVLGNPRVEALHGSDIVQIVAAGLCFGVAVLLLVQRVLARGR